MRSSRLIGCVFLLFLAVATPVTGADPYFGYEFGIVGGSGLDAPGGEALVRTKDHRAVLGLSAPDGRWILGADYQYTRFEFRGVASRNRDFHRLQLPLAFRHRLADWRVEAFVAPGVAASSNVTDDVLDNATGDDYFVTAGIEGMRATGSNWHWLAGIAYDRTFGAPTLYPVVGALYDPGGPLTLRAAFPRSELRIERSARQRIALRVFPAGAQWHVVSDELGDDFVYNLETWRLQATFSIGLGVRAWLDVSAGYDVARRHDFLDDRGAHVVADARDEPFLGVGLRWGSAPLGHGHAVALPR